MKKIKSKDLAFLKDFVYPTAHNEILDDLARKNSIEDMYSKHETPLFEEKSEPFLTIDKSPKENLIKEIPTKANYEEWLNNELSGIFTSSFSKEWGKEFNETLEHSVLDLGSELKDKIKTNLFKTLRSDVLAQEERLVDEIMHDLIQKYREEMVTRLNSKKENIMRSTELYLQESFPLIKPPVKSSQKSTQEKNNMGKVMSKPLAKFIPDLLQNPKLGQVELLKHQFRSIFGVKQKIAFLLGIPLLTYFLNSITPSLFYNNVSVLYTTFITLFTLLFTSTRERQYFNKIGMLRAFYTGHARFRFITYFVKSIVISFCIGFLTLFNVEFHFPHPGDSYLLNVWVSYTNKLVPLIQKIAPTLEIIFIQQVILCLFVLTVSIVYLRHSLKHKKYYY